MTDIHPEYTDLEWRELVRIEADNHVCFTDDIMTRLKFYRVISSTLIREEYAPR